ncbi:radical SAM family heme chaperone HemW [Lederbergia galactosidilytica]|uniref:Heme chaperone HemW n=1 Tax=Lederbergia galactosidilytica TaxID=217031 RepID=A0A178A3S5_9BACI|nr:radical SAM family heme chaperone HemW [Lederbergia galactosidilytica]KRG15534.1 coproporphyrinogen III oxidase [Virgibacillus soli]MBP1914836.1 oxygen-independent coproporphyrinogen-3 oxidase [Lederbergia galactosidilytica]OAK74732.1 coproporphyrinogen III oxidase [Lederbergia galactosidilytica]
MKAAYIHIPFCEHICYYCDFNKFFLQGQPVDEYLQSLFQEFKMTFDPTATKELETIFVGGGTPTALNERQLEILCKGIRENLPFTKGEFTFEANPGDLTKEKLKILAHYGVNRLSFGVQSFNNDLLEKIGRSHRVQDVYRSIEQAQELGFENISIDLIYALPQQTLADFRDTLQKALELNLPHYSGYSLIVEPKTIFYNLMRKGKLPLPSEDEEADMYRVLMEEMEKKGLQQYEISNFSRPGYESKHNLIYWNNEEYYGFGAGAHGYINGVRYSNAGPLKKYMEPISEGERPVFTENSPTKKEMLEEEMFLGLRKIKGVSVSHFQNKFTLDPYQVFQPAIKNMTERGLLEIQHDHIRLTEKGRFLGNEVFQAFLLS